MTLTRRAGNWLQRKALELFPVLSLYGSGRSWWPFIHEVTTGGWQRNQIVAIDAALSNPTIYSCVTLIAGDIAKLRPMLMQQDADGIWTEVDSPAFSPVIAKPNGYQTRIDFYEWWVTSKLNHGNTYVLKARDSRGVVSALYILDPYRVVPLQSPDGSIFYQLAADPLADVQESVVVPAREIIHDVCCPLFHPLCGVPPLFAAGFPALQGMNIRNASDKFFKNGSRPGGLLLVPGQITQDQANKMKADWVAGFSGDNQGNVAVLSGGMTYQAMGMSAEQSLLVDQLRMSDEDIAKCYHMPRHKVGIGPDPTYNNIEALNQQYYTDCLQKPIGNIQILLTEGLELDNVSGKTLGIQFDLDELLAMDTVSRADVSEKAVRGGLSYNEARKKFWKVGPVKGGESPLAQQQNFSLEALAKRDALPNPFVIDRPAVNPTPSPTGPAVTTDPQQTTSPKDLLAMIRRKRLELAA